MQELTIVTATIEDVPQLVALVNSAYRGETSTKGWTTEAHLLDGIRIDEATMQHLIDTPDAVILKCLYQHELKGCVYLHQKEAQLYLGMLTVAPEAQAKGIGKFLLQAAEHYAISKHCRTIVMTVISVRHELIEWYQRQGYKATGEKEPFPDDPRFGIPKQSLEFMVMEKKLPF